MEYDQTVVDNRQYDTRGRRKRVRTKGRMDYALLLIIMVLTAFGIIMVYSSSYYTASLSSSYNHNPAYFAIRQAAYAMMGIVAMVIVSHIDYHIWYKKSLFRIMYFTMIILMALVFVFGIEVNGAKRWIEIPGIGVTFQPSEIAKVVIVLTLARLLYTCYRKLNDIRILLAICAIVGVFIILAGIENLSSAIIMSAIVGIMIIFAVPRWKDIGVLVIIAGVMLVIIFSFKAYRSDRISEWHNQDVINGAVTQSGAAISAIGSGGLFGSGIGQSLQKMGTLSEAHNDMIFSIICEEFGFVGGIAVIVLFVVMILRMSNIVVNAYDLYGSLIVVGVMAHIGVQAAINMAVVTGVSPNTGVPLPFISYGGTSLIFLFGEIGLVMSVARSMMKE
ncbi:MAG: putative lipid II flippase FtsW [Lachnospiraceae bacterium]|nr:putative lipid II flippase FtsW [Lachnospiraceae bacterium]